MFYSLLQCRTPEEIAEFIGLSGNTVKRWIEQDRVPWQYHGDFLRMLGKDGDIDLSGDPVKDKDQFYTKNSAALRCWEMFLRTSEVLGADLDSYHFIEPSAGGGSFFKLLPHSRRTAVEIDPKGDYASEMIKGDYLRWMPDMNMKYAVIGNPPFGLRGHLALQFINHSACFADIAAFVLPQLFGSDGKGAAGKRVDSAFRLAFSERLPEDSFENPSGEPMSISTVFQIWVSASEYPADAIEDVSCSSFVAVYSLSDGGTPATTRNKAMTDRCDVYLPSTCFSGMQAYASFEDLPNRRGYGIKILKNKDELMSLLRSNDWTATAFKSTNGALNLRTSLIEKVVTDGGFAD